MPMICACRVWRRTTNRTWKRMIPTSVSTSTSKTSRAHRGVPSRAPLAGRPWPGALILVYPHDRFLLAIRTVRSATLSRILGRPGPLLADPSHFLATSFLSQRRSVSGVTIPANWSRLLRPSALAFTLNRLYFVLHPEVKSSLMQAPLNAKGCQHR